MIFNKKGLFGGGLCLVNTAVVAISTSSVVVAEEECRVRNKQNQIYWRIYAHNMRLNATGKSAWIKDEKYRDSIINVIGKAIGDCMALENEFKGCYDREKLGDKIILFEGKDKYKDPYDYTIKNWNAVYLYNAVNLAINNEKCWGFRAVKADELLEKCHERIKNHYEQFYWIHTEDDKKRQRRKVSELDEQKKLIENVLQKKCKFEKWQHSPENANNIDNIEKLQKAINNLDEKNGNIENLVNDAIDQLNAAKSALLRNVSFKQEYLTREGEKVYQIEFYEWVKDYLLNRRDSAIASLELHKNLEQAKSNILEYFQALHLDKILEDEYRYYARNFPGSPAKVTKENAQSKKKRGKKYNVFRYFGLIMDCEVNKQVTYNNTAAVQEIGYFPDFCAQKDRLGYIQDGSIYISGVRKIKWTHNKYSCNQAEKLGYYDGDKPGEYKELLELLQGLVVPLE